MKMNIKGLVFVGFAAAVFASAANAANDKTVTSKTYVDTKYVGDTTTITVTEGTGANAGKKVISLAEGLDGSPYTGTAPIVVDQQEHEISVTVDGTVSDGNTGIVSGGTVYTAVDARVPKQIGTSSDEGKVLKVNNQGQVTLSAADEYQKKLTAGNFVAIDPSTNTITTTYSEGTGIDISNTGVISVDTEDLTNYAAGTNVTFTQGAAGTENEGKTVISATDTTYTAGTGLTLTGTEFSVNGELTDTHYSFQEGTTAGNFQYKEGDGSWTNVPVHNAQTTDNITQNIANNSTSTTLYPSAKAVYDFMNNGAATANCSDANPCAFVLGTSGVPEWKPIQQ